jgi:methyl-accepting chemotaxis protein
MNTTMNRRRNYFINKDFQIRFIQRFLVSTTVWAVAAAAFFAYFAKRRLQDALYSSHLTIKSTAELLGPSTLLAHAIALVLFAALLAYAIYALWKKLSVPLYMLKKDLVRIASGDLVNDVTLREEDEFQKLAAEIDEMRKELRRKLVRIKEKHADVSTAVSGLDRVLLQGQPVSNQAESIKAAAARLLEELHAFTL